MIETYRGYVNTWECDDVGHMNVQFYMSKLDSSLEHLRLALGLGPTRIRNDRLYLRPTCDHVRFLSELRVSDCLTIESGILEIDERCLTVYSEMRNSVTADVSATFVTQLESMNVDDGRPAEMPEDLKARARNLITTLPDYATPRSAGLGGALPVLARSDIEKHQLVPIYNGVITPAQCNVYGWMTQPHYMGRYSDGGGHLWNALNMDRQSLNAVGMGVALIENEQRYIYPLRPGMLITVASAIRSLARKTTGFAHYMFNAETGTLVATAEATAVLLDLEARRSVEFTPEQQSKLRAAMKAQRLF